jgi:KUP system potassium uptake protein
LGSDHQHHQRLTGAGLLITLGIIFGDIGTSPLYVLRAIVGERMVDETLVLGGVSCIFWTLTLQTTVKYILLILRADNKGEGGVFSLYTLVRKSRKKWLLVPAVIGGSALLGEGIITPAISVSSAVEGITDINPDINPLPIIMGIIAALFFIQQFGAKFIGRSFGPVMFVWFMFLALMGFNQLVQMPSVLNALNPVYGYDLLVKYPGGFWILGAVFLCTTGAEALYSDLGHCGKQNIRVSWIFVKTALLLNYFGQSAWLMQHSGEFMTGTSPFYAIVPESILPFGIIIATSATIVASQALISGSFTLINEAMRLNLWPKVKVVYPTNVKGQLYIPSINWILMLSCLGVILYFRKSANMEAAYGLTIIIGMMMSSILLYYFMILKRFKPVVVSSFVITYAIIETSFLIANLEKFPHGGWVSMLIASVIAVVMWLWWDARKIRNSYVEFVKLDQHLKLIDDLSRDLSIPKYSTHLVYLTSAERKDEIESKVIYSILQKQPKRADIYWFVHVELTDEPYTMEYKVTEIIKNDIIRVDFRLGFRIAPRINLMFRKVVTDLVKSKEVDITSRYESLNRYNVVGDFRFVVMEKFLSNENELPWHEKLILKFYFILKSISLSEERAFGLDTSSVTVEKVPLVISPVRDMHLKRIP